MKTKHINIAHSPFQELQQKIINRKLALSQIYTFSALVGVPPTTPRNTKLHINHNNP